MPGLCKEFVQSNAHFPIFYRLHWHQAVSKTQYYNLDALILKTGLVTPQHQLPSCWFGDVPRISRQNANAPCWIETATKGHRKFKHFHLCMKKSSQWTEQVRMKIFQIFLKIRFAVAATRFLPESLAHFMQDDRDTGGGMRMGEKG